MIDRQTAEKEFERFIEEMDLELDEKPEDERKALNEYIEVIIKNIMRGSLVIDEKGQPVFTPQRTEEAKPITFFEPTGASLQAADQRKAGQDVAKLNCILGSICKTAPKTFASMKLKDYKVCQSVLMVFLS